MDDVHQDEQRCLVPVFGIDDPQPIDDVVLDPGAGQRLFEVRGREDEVPGREPQSDFVRLGGLFKLWCVPWRPSCSSSSFSGPGG